MSTSSPTSPGYIYKIAPSTPRPSSPSPTSFSSDPILPVSYLDASSGYIHMSTASQIAGTLKLFFPTSSEEQNEVWLLKVRVGTFDGGKGEVKWESPDGTVTGDREGEGLFPHLYLGGKEERRLWLRRGEVVDVRSVVCGNGEVSWEGGIDELMGEGWLV